MSAIGWIVCASWRGHFGLVNILIFNQEAREVQNIWLLQLNDTQEDSIRARATNYTDRATLDVIGRALRYIFATKPLSLANGSLRRLRPRVRCCPF